jgi:peptide/nickel transport system permease protein
MLNYILYRLGYTVVVMLGVAIIVFGLLHLSGDPVFLVLPTDATPDMIATVRKMLALDQPLATQFLLYMERTLRGDLGTSFRYNLPVSALLATHLPVTLELSAAAMGIAVVLAIPAGIVAAARRGTAVDQVTMVGALAGQAMPVFWLALLLIWVFAVRLRWLPVYGQGGPLHLILPAVSLSAIVVGRLARLVRSSMLDVLHQNYVRTARAKGLAGPRVMTHHALKNAAIPIVTLLGLQAAQLLGGAVVTETIFAWQGVGSLVIEAVFNRDFPVVQAVTLAVSLVFVLVNLLVDLSYAVLDPRIRFG